MALLFKRIRLAIFLTTYFTLLMILFFKILPYHIAFDTDLMPTLVQASDFFFAFWAGALNFFQSCYAISIGVLILVYLLFCSKEIIRNKFVFSWIVFCFIVDLLLVRTRGTGDIQGALFSRYATYSLLSIILTIPLLLRYSVINDSWKSLINIGYCIGKVFFTQEQCNLQEEFAKRKWRPYLNVLFLIALISFKLFMVARHQKAYAPEYHVVKTSVFYPNIPVAISLYETAKAKGIYSSEQLDAIIEKEKAQDKL